MASCAPSARPVVMRRARFLADIAGAVPAHGREQLATGRLMRPLLRYVGPLPAGPLVLGDAPALAAAGRYLANMLCCGEDARMRPRSGSLLRARS